VAEQKRRRDEQRRRQVSIDKVLVRGRGATLRRIKVVRA